MTEMGGVVMTQMGGAVMAKWVIAPGRYICLKNTGLPVLLFRVYFQWYPYYAI